MNISLSKVFRKDAFVRKSITEMSGLKGHSKHEWVKDFTHC